MGYKQDAEEALKSFCITKIDWQPMYEDITKLSNKLTKMATTITTMNGGGLHGHMGVIFEDVHNPDKSRHVPT